MPTPDPLDELRAELRRLFREATGGPRGRWKADEVPGSRQTHVYGVAADGSRRLVTISNTLTDGRLMAAARNSLPLLFRSLDDARATRTVPVLGDVIAGGAVAWRGVPPGPVPADPAPAA